MFNISIQQDVLMNALNFLEPTVGKNLSGFSDNCISIKTTGFGTIELYTTNTIEFTRVEAVLSSGVGGNTIEQCPLVDFKRLKTIIASIPSNEIVTIEEDASTDLHIRFSLKKSPVKLTTVAGSAIPLPNNTFPMSSAITVPKTPIKEAADNAASIMENSTSAIIYNCMRIYTTGNLIEVTGLDMAGKRTFVQTFNATNNNPTGDVLVEASKLKRSMKIFVDFNELEFMMDNTMIMIAGVDPVSQLQQKTNGMIPEVHYYCRRLTGAFPNNIAANLTPAPLEYVEINSQDMKECFARVKAIEDNTSTGAIGFESNGNDVVIVYNSTYGSIEDNIPTENLGHVQSFKTTFNYSQFNEIIKTLNSEVFEIGVLPNHPTNFVVKAKADNNVMFTIPAMAVPTPAPANIP